MTQSVRTKAKHSEQLAKKTEEIIKEICEIVNERPLALDAEAYLNTALIQLGLVRAIAREYRD